MDEAPVKLLIRNKENDDPQNTLFARLARKVLRVTEDFREQRFFVRVDGKMAVTPLFLALLVVECMDVVFAVDSIPAVLAITTDPFLVFTSNVFAILSLRSLFFAVSAMLDKLHYLETSLAAVLAFVGIKMLLGEHYKIPTHWSLAVILVLLGAGAIASWLRKRG